jgi:arylsulfatase A-like enzyme
VGEIASTLDRLHLADNTIVMFTSDNGPVLDDGYQDQAANGHKPAGPLRGGKYSAFDAGTRVPFIVRWPGRTRTATSGALVCQIDFLASFAALTGQALAPGAGPDSVNLLATLTGRSGAGRDHLVEQADALSIIVGAWKYIEPHEGQKVERTTNIELGNDPAPQLYDLAHDIGERRNVAAAHPEKVRELSAHLARVRSIARPRGLARPGSR